ncbi:U2 small nuclear ribonucleoprotein A' [Friedmanniomyces simplex]|uniref:U2 small nuclear ribonucleoprotein A' n=1 Tax=Friedmanniomyces simplex TaxID=329884 RepID=A0A4U0XX38_9PEZI|nr:U2 small nuclear ribonucleoprotein A' [Friedmanniomyces simplex]
MRLTAELINNSLSYLNPLKERELDLRGHKIPSIENLGVAKDHEAIDFTDNDLSVLTNFPLSPRLQTLLCARNRISSIQPTLAKSLPSLHTLVLTHNNISELADLDPLQGFGKLTHVSLLENPVTSKENYRYWVLWRAPQIRYLDFQKVRDVEREKAKELFGTSVAPTELAQGIIAVRSNKPLNYAGAPTVNGGIKGQKLKITEKEKKRFEALVRKAKTLAEVQKLEKAFSEGRLPAGVGDEDAMDEA